MNTKSIEKVETVTQRKAALRTRRTHGRPRGMTLVELLSVLVVLATLVLIARPYVEWPPAANADVLQHEAVPAVPIRQSGEQAGEGTPAPGTLPPAVSEDGNSQIAIRRGDE